MVVKAFRNSRDGDSDSDGGCLGERVLEMYSDGSTGCSPEVIVAVGVGSNANRDEKRLLVVIVIAMVVIMMIVTDGTDDNYCKVVVVTLVAVMVS